MSVSVKYKGTEIASMDETGTKTLLTSGKYCDADIVVENTKDSSSFNAQAKTATPSFSQQQILPDEGYDGLSQVTVAAIPVAYVDNDQNGKTVIIG